MYGKKLAKISPHISETRKKLNLKTRSPISGGRVLIYNKFQPNFAPFVQREVARGTRDGEIVKQKLLLKVCLKSQQKFVRQKISKNLASHK